MSTLEIKKAEIEQWRQDSSPRACKYLYHIAGDTPSLAMTVLDVLKDRPEEAAIKTIGDIAYSSHNPEVIEKSLELLSLRQEDQATTCIELIGSYQKGYVDVVLLLLFQRDPQNKFISDILYDVPVVRQLSLLSQFNISTQSDFVKEAVRNAIEPDSLFKMSLEECSDLREVMAEAAQMYPKEIPSKTFEIIDNVAASKKSILNAQEQYYSLYPGVRA